MDSGVLQPTDLQVRILFAHAGCIPWRFKKCLIKDEREHLQTLQLLETALDLDASIIIGSAFPEDTLPDGRHMGSLERHTKNRPPTTWHVWYEQEICSVTDFHSAPLSEDHLYMRGRECAMLHLRHHQGYEIHLMFLMILRGTAAAASTLELGLSARQEVLDAAFRFLTKRRKCPAMVAGDFGLGLATLHAFIRMHPLKDKVQANCIQQHTFHTLFYSAKPEYQCTTINTGSPRMLQHQVQFNSGDQHPTAPAKPLSEDHVEIEAKPLSEDQVKITTRRQVNSGDQKQCSIWPTLEPHIYAAPYRCRVCIRP